MGIVGTGKIGLVLGRIMTGLGCRLLATDPFQNEGLKQLDGCYVTLPELLAASAIVSLHCPLMADTRHTVDGSAITRMKPGATSRGAVIDTRAVIAGLKSGKIGQHGLDVYEEEVDIFFDDRSEQLVQDDVFTRLLTFPNVLVTGHQAFFTSEALTAIADTTIANITAFAERGQPVQPVRRCQK